MPVITPWQKKKRGSAPAPKAEKLNMPLVFVLQTEQIFVNIFSDLGNIAGMETTIMIIFPRVMNLCYSFNVPLLAEMSVRRAFVYRDTAFNKGTALYLCEQRSLVSNLK